MVAEMCIRDRSISSIVVALKLKPDKLIQIAATNALGLLEHKVRKITEKDRLPLDTHDET